MKSRLIFLLLVVLTMGSLAVAAASLDEPAKSPAVQAAEDRAAIALAERQEAEERRKRIEAMFPSRTNNPITGETTINDGVKLESEILAYAAMEKIAQTIAGKVKGKNPKTIVLYDADSFKGVSLYEVFLGQTRTIADGYKAALAKKAQPQPLTTALAFPAAMAGMGALTDLLSFFRQETKYYGRSFDLKAEALSAALAGELKDLKVFHPSMLFIDFPELKKLEKLLALPAETGEEANPVFAALGDLAVLKKKAEVILDLADARDTAQARFDQLYKTDKNDTEALKKQQAAIDAGQTALEKDGGTEQVVAGLRAAKTLHEALIAVLVKGDEKGGIPALGALLFGGRLAKILAEPGTYTLQAEVATAGGTYRTRKNLWTTMFTGDLLSYSGGAVVSYKLFNNKSEIALATTYRHATGFTKFKGGEKPEASNLSK